MQHICVVCVNVHECLLAAEKAHLLFCCYLTVGRPHDNPHPSPWQPTPAELGPTRAAAMDAEADPPEVIIIYVQAHKYMLHVASYTLYIMSMFECDWMCQCLHRLSEVTHFRSWPQVFLSDFTWMITFYLFFKVVFPLLLVLFVWFLLMTCLVLVYDLVMTEIFLFSQQPEDEADLLDQDAMEPGLPWCLASSSSDAPGNLVVQGVFFFFFF